MAKNLVIFHQKLVIFSLKHLVTLSTFFKITTGKVHIFYVEIYVMPWVHTLGINTWHCSYLGLHNKVFTSKTGNQVKVSFIRRFSKIRIYYFFFKKLSFNNYYGKEIFPWRAGKALQGRTRHGQGPVIRIYRINDGKRKDNSRCKYNYNLHEGK